MVRAIYDAYPMAAKERHVDGNYALSLALDVDTSGETPTDLVIDILRTYPEAAGVMDHSANFPLHLALQYESQWSSELIQSLLDACPLVINEKDWNGMTPHQLALKKNASSGMLELLETVTIDKINEWKRFVGHMLIHCFSRSLKYMIFFRY